MKVLKIACANGDVHHMPLERGYSAAFVPNFPDAHSVELMTMSEDEYMALPVDAERFTDD